MAILLSIINVIIRSNITIKRKQFRKAHANSLGIFTTLSCALPLRIPTFLYLYHIYSFNFSFEYIGYMLIWTTCTLINNVGGIYLFKHQALSEQGVYKLLFGIIMSIFADIYFFNTTFNPYMIISIILLFIAGITLTQNKTQDMKIDKNFLQGIGLIIFISILGVIQTSSYKYGMGLQPNMIIHGMFCQIMLYSIVFIIGFHKLRNNIKQDKIQKIPLIFIGVGIFILTILETYVIKVLPVTIITLLGILNILIYKLYDIYSKELKFNIQTIISFILVVISLLLITFKSGHIS